MGLGYHFGQSAFHSSALLKRGRGLVQAVSAVLCVITSPRLTVMNRDPSRSREAFTDLRTAFIQVKSFRPMLTRVPHPDRVGMSSVSSLALEVNGFDVKGAFGEDCWGSPVDVQAHDDLRAWTEGLRNDGGGGCVCTRYY